MPDFGKALRGLKGEKGEEGSDPRWQRDLSYLRLSWSREGSDPFSPFSPLSLRPILPPGEIQSNSLGSHYLIQAAYPHDHFHGKIGLSRLSSADLVSLITVMREKAIVPHRDRIVFLDTETTGVQGGTGICPFLVGLGYFIEDNFQMVQFFIRDFDEEPSMLLALGELLQRFDLVVTYNGAAFDIPLLETRFTLSRLGNPFSEMSHFDLLFTARRLWRNGHGSCRLTALERELLSFMRGPDIPGAMIPRAYFDYLQRRANTTLRSVFTHNVDDVLSLAALTVHACDRVIFEPAYFDEPMDLYSLGRIFEDSNAWRRSIRFYEMALSGGVDEPVRQRVLESLGKLYRRAGEYEAALTMLERALEGAGTGRKFRQLEKLIGVIRGISSPSLLLSRHGTLGE